MLRGETIRLRLSEKSHPFFSRVSTAAARKRGCRAFGASFVEVVWHPDVDPSSVESMPFPSSRVCLAETHNGEPFVPGLASPPHGP